jgi:AraC-like DNA-binding protein
VGGDTHHWVHIYRLPGTSNDVTAIPLHYKGTQRFQQDLERAAARLFIDPRALKAFAWNLMWAVGRDSAFARTREELYAAEDYIQKNLSGHLIVSDIAEASGKSPRQLLRTFREEHGMTIQEYIRHRRVREATRLLSTTRTPVKEVASRVGVPDLHAFNKLIREETGLSPRRFREKSMEDRLS